MRHTTIDPTLLDYNHLQMESISVLSHTVEGKYTVFCTNRDTPTNLAIGVPDDDTSEGYAKPFTINTDGQFVLALSEDRTADVDALHFAVYCLSYPSLRPEDASNQNEEFAEKAHAVIHFADTLNLPIPITVTIQAIRLLAVDSGIITNL